MFKCVLYLKIFLHAWFVSVCYNLGFQISDLQRIPLVKSVAGNTVQKHKTYLVH